ncbi:MAG: MBL fold metallo-hydrolase [Elusimicrobia bacterium]|nr:MBL fold metallo-hydrolase [Elusimicrobiota bacterium]
MIKTDFVVSGDFEVNCFLVYEDISKKAVVIDPGYDGKSVINKIDSLGLKPELLINTHGHFDHIFSDDMIREKYNIPLAIHKDDIEMLASAELNSSTVIEEPITVKNPEIIFDKDETKGTSFCKYSVIHTPGHSKGSVCILIDDMLFAGDTVFYGSIGRTDLFGGDYDAIISSLNKIKALPKETKIFPGHGPVTTLERELYHNPYFK